jgi:DNA (cytosine-5)-methyltransferase 1
MSVKGGRGVKAYYLDLFSGIGGFMLGACMAGVEFDGVYFSEVDEYAKQLYRQRYPQAVSLGDARNIDYSKLPKGAWYVTGGFPCQPHSQAGKRRASEDERDLWPECARALRDLRPEYAIFENVAGILNSEGGRFFNRVMYEIYESGYDAEWQSISAVDVGAPHRRDRIWIVCYPRADCARNTYGG